jgi:hypothetical protein
MKVQITNRRALLKNFNEENCTAADCSKYVGAEVLTDRNEPLAVGFKHTNGSGYKVLTFRCVDQAYGTVECNESGYEATSQHLRCV